MKRFEYKSETVEELITSTIQEAEARFNTWGKQGWAVFSISAPYMINDKVIFKVWMMRELNE